MSAVKEITAVVPSLRVDVLGARAFGVSRSYFAKGIASGSVTCNDQVVGKSASAEVGQQFAANTLGTFVVASVDGETRRGNVKVTLHVTRER